MESYGGLLKDTARIPRKPERPYISSLKSCSMEPRRRPLRTYSKRTSTESTEPPPKRRCIVTSSETEEASITPSEPENNAASSMPSTPPLPPIKKGTITAYFGRIPQSPAATLSWDSPSSPLLELDEPTITPPSSPPIITTRKRRARRLKTRVVTKCIDEEANDEEHENQDGQERIGRIREVKSPGRAPSSALSESLPDSLNQSRRTSSARLQASKPREDKRREKKQAPVQTTLSLSMNEAHYTECKECGMLYNHLHETDVKYHSRRHAALRKARAQECVEMV